jgi:hypothetical protein
MRWRAAHAIRRLAEIERFDVIGQLVSRFETSSGLPFVDAKLPFYSMHARLWLLIAIARIALDRPDQIIPHRPLLERVAFSTEFPHVAMRSVAIDALRALASFLEDADRDALLARLATANLSPFQREPRQDYGERRFMQRPEAAPRPEDAFHLDYDFDKYQVEGLCRVFDCAGWEVEDGITSWVKRWDAAVHSMHECPRSRSYDDLWPSRDMPDFDRYGGYLAGHALMLVAGEMLRTRVVTGDGWRSDPWEHFIGEYRVTRSDGLWLADATDLFPLDLPREDDVPMPGPGGRSVEREDHSLLAPMLGVANGELASDWMPVGGLWSLARDTTVTMRSVLAGSNDARAAVMTLLSEKSFFRYLPDSVDEIERNFGVRGHSVRAWIESVQNSERQLDRHDPYAARTATNRSPPADWVRETLALTPDDTITRLWLDASGPAFRAEAWGAEGGRGEQAWEISGHRLFARRSALFSLLQSNGLCLVASLKVQRYHRGESSGRIGYTSPFTHRSFVFTLKANGRVWAPLRVSPAARAAVANLEERDRRDFGPRFRAIAALTSGSPRG